MKSSGNQQMRLSSSTLIETRYRQINLMDSVEHTRLPFHVSVTNLFKINVRPRFQQFLSADNGLPGHCPRGKVIILMGGETRISCRCSTCCLSHNLSHFLSRRQEVARWKVLLTGELRLGRSCKMAAYIICQC